MTPPADALVMIPGPSSTDPHIAVRGPVLATADGAPHRMNAWLATLSRYWVDQDAAARVTRISAGPEEMWSSRARKALIGKVLIAGVTEHLAGRDTSTLMIVDLTGAYQHTGVDDDQQTAAMGHAVIEAFKAARQTDGLPLIIATDTVSSLPDSLTGFETLVSAGAPPRDIASRLTQPPADGVRPAQPPPSNHHVWITTGGEWSLTPTARVTRVSPS